MLKNGKAGWLAFRRLERAIESVAEARGLDGDMFDDSYPRVGKFDDQLLIVGILDELPRRISRQCPSLAKLLVTRLVLSSTVTGETACEPGPNRSRPSAGNSPVGRERSKAAHRLARRTRR